MEAHNCLYNALQGRPELTSFLHLHGGSVKSVAISPDGRTIAAGVWANGNGSDRGVVLWDLAARKRLGDEPLSVKGGYVRSVAFSPDGKTIAAGFDSHGGGGVVLWDVAARKRLATSRSP